MSQAAYSPDRFGPPLHGDENDGIPQADGNSEPLATCSWCGETFDTGISDNDKYCSRNCNLHARNDAA